MRLVACVVALAIVACDSAETTGAQAQPERTSAVPEARGGRDLVGRRPAAWPALEWIGSDALDWDRLRGKVVLVRFWTDTCPYCAASAPTLRALHEELGDDGLVVIGVHHPKPRGRRVPSAEVREAVRRFGWTFPVAVDRDWRAIDAMWLTQRRRATSASLLVDREGVVRWVHPGPEYAPGSRDAAELRRAIDALL